MRMYFEKQIKNDEIVLALIIVSYLCILIKVDLFVNYMEQDQQQNLIRAILQLSLKNKPKKHDKLSQINTFLDNPQLIHEKEDYQKPKNHNKSKQKHKKPQDLSLRKLQSSLTGTIDQQQLGNMQQQREIIKQQMKKYLPKNSSFTAMYEEKLYLSKNQLDKNKLQFQKNKLKLPQLPSHKNYKNNIILTQRNEQDKSGLFNRKNFDKLPNSSKHYIKLLQNIRNDSLALRQKSGYLANKTQETQRYIEKQYKILAEYSEQIVTGTKKYKLQQQKDKRYKKQLMKIWMNSDRKY